MTDWAAKVLAGVPRFQTMGGNWLPEADALAAIARMGAGDGLVERAGEEAEDLRHTGDLSMPYRCEIADTITALIAHIAALTAQNREMAFDVLASSGQAQEAYAAQTAAEAERDALRAKVAEHEKAAQENDPSNLWRFWANKAQEIADNNAALRAKVARLEGVLRKLHHAVCGEAGFAACVRLDSGKAYPWPALDDADEATRAALTDGAADGATDDPL